MPAGRPLIEIDWIVFDKLCGLQCTIEELAAFFNCSVDTITRACEREKGCNFAGYYAQKKGSGKVALRRKQLEVALSGNPAMLIWLGKNYLNQADKQEIDHNFPKPTVIERPDGSEVEVGVREDPAKPL